MRAGFRGAAILATTLLIFCAAPMAGAPEAESALDPAQLDTARIQDLLELAQARLDALEVAQDAADRGEPVLRIGDRMVPIPEGQLAELTDNLADLVDFARLNSATLREELAERVAQLAEGAAADVAQDFLGQMADRPPESTGGDALISLAMGELARAAARSVAETGDEVTLAAIRSLIRGRINALRVTAREVERETAEWQEIYDALDALLDERSNAPDVTTDSCHADIEVAHDRILARDFDLYIGDINGTGRYLRGQDGVYCAAGGHHFYVDGGQEWQRWERHGGEWHLNSYLVITEREGSDARGRPTMTGFSRRIGEDDLRTRYTITYLH